MKVPLLFLAFTFLFAVEATTEFQNPYELISERGYLSVTLVGENTTITLAGQSVTTRCYNESWLLPTLRVKRGDVVYIKVINHFDESVNFHFHGMSISPLQPADDIFIGIFPAGVYHYKFVIPMDHKQGLFWYHSHIYGLSEFQVMSGMSGFLIVDGVLDIFPELSGISEKLILLKDIQIQNGVVPSPEILNEDEPTNRLVSGLYQPTIKIAHHEVQFWRVGNIGSDIYYNISLGGVRMFTLTVDGNMMNQLIPVESILLPPASRTEFFIIGPEEGSYQLTTSDITTGPPDGNGDFIPSGLLLNLISHRSPPWERPFQADIWRLQLPAVEDLRDQTPYQTRTFMFSETDTAFLINGKVFDPHRLDTVVPWGHVEEWEILNNATEFHVFHIHQVDFQVVEVNYSPAPFYGTQDNVNIPFRQNGTPGQLKIRIAFTEPQILGEFVYHCHILAHEDGGMMATIKVVNVSDCVTITFPGNKRYTYCPLQTRTRYEAHLACDALNMELADINTQNIVVLSREVTPSVWVNSWQLSLVEQPCVALFSNVVAPYSCASLHGVLCQPVSS